MNTANEETLPSSAERVPSWVVLATSFWGGFQIMALEICGFRVLQTSLGSSVVVTGTLLTVIMILLSAGYYVGGHLSSRLETTRSLFALLAVASLYSIVVTALFLEPLASVAESIRAAHGLNVHLRSGLAAGMLTIALYGLPMFLMSMISPYWIRLQTVGARAGADAGVQSGFFMSLSTVGSIVGTMLASYVLLPFIGVASTAISSSAVFLFLVALGYVLSSTPEGQPRVAKVLASMGLTALSLTLLGARSTELDPGIIYQAESMYGEIRIEKTQDEAGRELLAYHPSRVYTHSILYPQDPLRDLEGLMYLAPGWLTKPRKVLVLGSAVGGVLRGLEVAFPEAHMVGVDIDPEVHRVATELFGIDPKRNTLVSADARVFVAEDKELYDLIIVDLFAGEFIPTHCVSQEFFSLVRRRLAPGGGVFVNTNMHDVHHELPSESEPFRAVRHLQSTLAAAGFPALFENAFFHSMFAFDRALPIEQLREGFRAKLEDTHALEGVRVGAGLALYTTSEVHASPARYRPFTDAWAPAFLIEQKSNLGNLYEALSTRTPGDEVQDLVLREQLHAWETSDEDEPALSDLAPLLRSLAGHEGSKPSIDIGARHFRFAAETQPVPTAQPSWSELAKLYAQLYHLGEHNDREQLLPVLDQMRVYL